MRRDNGAYCLLILVALELGGKPEHLLSLVVEPPLEVRHPGGGLVVLNLHLVKLLPLELERVLQRALQPLHALLVPLSHLHLQQKIVITDIPSSQ